MAINTHTIDDFIKQQVTNGSCATTQEAQKELIGRLIEKEIDAGIAEGMEDMKAGRVTVANEENDKAFLQEIEEMLFN